MLRYRVAFDSERGHFVLPVLPAMVRAEETFASRAAAQRVALGRNSRTQPPSPEETSTIEGDFLRTFLRRASA